MEVKKLRKLRELDSLGSSPGLWNARVTLEKKAVT